MTQQRPWLKLLGRDVRRHMNRHYCVIPVLTLIALIAVVYAALPQMPGFFDPLSYAVLNTILVGVISFVVAYFSARSYVLDGSISLLLLGSGMLAFGLAHVVGPWLGPKIGIPVGNIGYLFSSAIIVIPSVFVTAQANVQISRGRKQLAAVAYLVVLLFFAAVATASFQGVFPAFFIEGVGSTPIRLVVLGGAFVLYTLSALLLMAQYFKLHADLLFWYSLALVLVAVGLPTFLLARYVGGPIAWLGRIAFYLSGIYFTVGLLRTFKRTR